MKSTTIFKNKGEVFKCQFDVDGVAPEEVNIRLCLEFADGKNLFFYGETLDGGECTIKVPKLTEIEDKSGRLTIEAIADSVYFKLYECDVIIKNSVDMKITEQVKKEPTPVIKETKINLTKVEQESNPYIPKSALKNTEKESFLEYARRLKRSG